MRNQDCYEQGSTETTPKAQATEEKIGKSDFIKIYNFGASKDTQESEKTIID